MPIHVIESEGGYLPRLVVNFSFLKEWKGVVTHSIRFDNRDFFVVCHKAHFKGRILAFMV